MQDIALQMAKRFATSGYFVFPLLDTKYDRVDDNGKKKPLIMPYNWSGSSEKYPPEQHIVNTNDVSVIDQWTSEVIRIYESKLVIAGFGVVGKSCIIFDLDIKGGKNGVAEYNKLAALYSMPEPTMVVKTKSGGLHYYFARPAGYEDARIKNAASVVIEGVEYDGVDIRANKGYVVGPMSREIERRWTPGSYTLQSVTVTSINRLTPCNDKLIDLLGDHSVQYSTDTLQAMISDNQFTSAEDMAKQLVIPSEVKKGERNVVFYAFISAAVRKGLPENTLRELVKQLLEVTEDADHISDSVDLEDMIKRAYSVDLSNPYSIANDMVRKGLYRLSSHSLNNLTYFTMDETYISMDRPLNESQLAEVTSRFDRSKINKDGSISNRMDNVGKIIRALIPRENEVSRFGYVPGAKDLCTDESGRLKLMNLWMDPRELMVPKDKFNSEVWRQFIWLTERLCNKGSREFDYFLQFARWLLVNPGVRPVTYPLLTTGARGTGKNLLTECLAACMGYNKFGASQAKTLDKKSLSNTRFLNPTSYSLISFDEVEFAKASGSYTAAVDFNQSVKTLTTCTHYPVEIKGGASYDSPMYAGLIMTSNSVKGLVIDDEDRRTNLIYSDVAPLNQHGGEVDDLFRITKGIGSLEDRRVAVGTIIRGLCDLDETMLLDRQRAWDSETKTEARISTMTRPQRCLYETFESDLWRPIVSRSVIRWILAHCSELLNSKYTDHLDDTEEEIFKSSLIGRINLPGTRTKRQFYSLPILDMSGNIVSTQARGELFTIGSRYTKYKGGAVRPISDISEASAKDIKAMFDENIATIQDATTISKL